MSDSLKGSQVVLTRPATQGGGAVDPVTLDLNDLIGRVDQCLSEMLLAAEAPRLNVVDATTLKHHARDLVSGGNKVLELLKERGIE